jgi:hypothetical protein
MFREVSLLPFLSGAPLGFPSGPFLIRPNEGLDSLHGGEGRRDFFCRRWPVVIIFAKELVVRVTGNGDLRAIGQIDRLCDNYLPMLDNAFPHNWAHDESSVSLHTSSRPGLARYVPHSIRRILSQPATKFAEENPAQAARLFETALGPTTGWEAPWR